MKRLCAIMAAASVMICSIGVFSSCSKSNATTTEDQPGNSPNSFAVYTSDSISIGKVNISKETNGDARVKLELNKSVFSTSGPYKPMLQNSGMEGSPLVLAYLNPINSETGISETSPVISTNRNIPYSYDAMMFTRVLKLVVTDANNNVIAFSQIR